MLIAAKIKFELCLMMSGSSNSKAIIIIKLWYMLFLKKWLLKDKKIAL